ncbi:MAG TPA: hypothetical protein VF792_08695 [Ktedonobacterales bacterium]
MERQGNPAVKWGLIFGVLLIVVELVNVGIEYATGTLTGSAATSGGAFDSTALVSSLARSCIVFLIQAGLYFTAGMMAARQNGRIGSGAIAGLIAGAMGGVVRAIVVVPLAMNMNFPVPSNSSMSPEQYHGVIVGGIIFGAVIGIGVGLGIGAGVAALGGLVGRSQFERLHPPQPMMESFYQPMAPAPGYPAMPQPGYPPAPGYPQYPQYPQQPGYSPAPTMPGQEGVPPQNPQQPS